MADAAAVVDAARGTPAQWGSLSRHLIASIFLCDSKGVSIDPNSEYGEPIIQAPLTDTNVEYQFGWQSPFESAGPEAKAPALMALIQSGQLAPVLSAIQQRIASGSLGDTEVGRNAAAFATRAEEASKSLEGRTGITKLNSRQVFSGMPPVRITAKLHFRTIEDPARDVHAPFDRLRRWAVPQELAPDGVLSEVIGSGSIGEAISNMFPSRAPTMIGLSYAGERYAPLVIESLGHPLDEMLSSDGKHLYRSVQVSLASLSAYDRSDIVKITAG